MAIQTILEFYYDKIETVGVVKRMFFYMLVLFEDNTKAWYYFGTDPVDKPPTTGDPINERPYIQLPQDLDDLHGFEANDILYSAARLIAIRREGLD